MRVYLQRGKQQMTQQDISGRDQADDAKSNPGKHEGAEPIRPSNHISKQSNNTKV